MKLLDGVAIAAEIREAVALEVAQRSAAAGAIRLAVILVGADPAARQYAEGQRKRFGQVGMEYELVALPAAVSQAQLIEAVRQQNRDPRVTGVLLQMPLPPGLDSAAAQFAIDPAKDVEGVHPENLGALFHDQSRLCPCTAIAVVELAQRSGMTLRGAEAVVVGRSRIVGRPVAMMLTAMNATVTVCGSATRDLIAHTRRAELLVVATGKPRMISASHVRPGAVVIDVGINSVNELDSAGAPRTRTVGDVDFDSVAPLTAAITPVPGGVGPVTVAMLLRNTLAAANFKAALR